MLSNGHMLKLQIIDTPGKYKLTITKPKNTEASEELKHGGIDTFLWCPNIQELIVSTWNFVKLFIGGWGQHNFMPFYNSKIPEY